MNYHVGTTVFKDWKITRELGEGAYGKVFEIQKTNFGITAISALKVLQVPRSQSDVQAAYSEGMDEQSVTGYFRECVERLVKEIAILSKLKGHTNIMGLEDYDVIQRDDVFGWDILIRMELLTSLQDHQRSHPLSEQDVIQLGRDLCSALSFCHKRNLIHRDIKPANIFVGAMGQYKLGDFGVSRNMEATVSNMSKAGTESYMAPEVYQGRPYSPNVDLYSLGLVLFQLSNNSRLPFLPPAPQPLRFSDRENALRRRMSGEPLPTPVGASQALSDVILRACAFDPRDRYQTADEMLDALNSLDSGLDSPNDLNSRLDSLNDLDSGSDSLCDLDGGLDSLEELDEPDDKTEGFFTFPEESTDKFGTHRDSHWDDDEKTEATLSVFGGRPAQKAAAGSVSPSQTRPCQQHPQPSHSQQQSRQKSASHTQKQPSPASAHDHGNRTPVVYFDRSPSGINKEIARKNRTPGQAEVWVTRNLMNGIVMGSFPGVSLSFFYDNGICWMFSGNTLRAYMQELQSAVNRGLHTITIINRFPELSGLHETIYLHLQETKGDDAPIAMYDGVSGLITRVGASGKWIGNQNIKPRFVSDGPCGNPFYGITSFLYQPPKRVRITSALAQLGTQVVLSGYGEPKKVMPIPPMAANLPSYHGNMTEELQPGQAANIAEFFRIEAIVPSNKLALWLPDDGKVYTAMMKGSAKEGKFSVVEYHQSKYVSLCKIFEH